MRLIIQIPCYNEEFSLPVVLSKLPREVRGFDEVLWLVVDDGSTDNTSQVAREMGVDVLVRHPRNLGLARAFMTGLRSSLERQADVIVNIDADNQYSTLDIPTLTDMVRVDGVDLAIGDRRTSSNQEFSPVKRFLQRLGTSVVRYVSGTKVNDAASGFRAMSAYAARRLYVFDSYTYTVETIIQAGAANLSVKSKEIRTNPAIRESRLVKSLGNYVIRSIFTIFRIFCVYKPLEFFTSFALLFMLPATYLAIRYLAFYLEGDGDGHLHSLLFSALLVSLAAISLITGFLAYSISANRSILEDIRVRSTPGGSDIPDSWKNG